MTTQEAIRLLEISKDYLPEDKLKEFVGKLDQEFNTNEAIHQSLVLLKQLLEPEPLPPRWLKPYLYAVIVVHFILVCAVGLSFMLMPFMILAGNVPWYVGVPVMVFIWFFSTSKVECKLTNHENNIRKRLKMKQIGGFVGHYFKKPARIFWNKITASHTR